MDPTKENIMLAEHSASTEGTTPSIEQIVECLKTPATYSYQPPRVEVIETHISWVFLTNRFAYKMKKPVAFEFVDFTTPHARRFACAEEIRLNRRLSHNVYIATLPITYDQRHGIELDGAGRVIDFVVKMRRLPADRALDQLIRDNRLHSNHINAISHYLVDFYTQLPPKVLPPEDHHQHLVNHCRANQRDLLGHLDDPYKMQIHRIHAAQSRYLALRKDLFYNRVRDGRIVDGHGDLRAEHIYMESPPAVIDCVEFSPELREVDVLDELCFLAMDCQRLGEGKAGAEVLAEYLTASGDSPPESLSAFYKSYRAAVRAKVVALRIEQTTGAERKRLVRELHQYLNWAEHYAARLGPTAMIVVVGLMGSGKSTLASVVADALGADLVQTDEVRRTALGASQTPAAYGTEIYQHDQRQRVYDEMLSRAGEILDEGTSVVLDGTFLTNALRRTAAACGRRHGARPMFVECHCPRDVAMARIDERARADATESEARPDLFDRQASEHEAIDGSIPAVRVCTTASVHDELRDVAAAVRMAVFND
ncbi:AAA family ATPase [Pirellulales bacterium]|nr:AAA family ATPase [Pirellulales bacterium]